MTHDVLIRGAWDAKIRAYGSGPVRAMVRRLRRKLGDDASTLTYFVTKGRVGYRMPKRGAGTRGYVSAKVAPSPSVRGACHVEVSADLTALTGIASRSRSRDNWGSPALASAVGE